MKALLTGRHIWWQKPKIRKDEDAQIERKASWLELFYDLMFVAILAQLSHYLFVHLTIKGAGTFIFLFIPAWWIWNSLTYYNERYEMNDIRHRIFTFLNMIPLAGIAFAIHDIFGALANVFAYSYIASRLLLIYLWLTAGDTKPERRLSYIFASGFSVTVVIWICSLFVPAPYKFFMWGLGLVIDLIIPLITLNTQKKLPKISTSHIPERFGLLIILTIGETVIASVNGLAANHGITLATALACAFGLCISFLIWWLYIDHVMYRVFKRNVWVIVGWSYLHLPLAVCITATGSGILAIVSASAKGAVSSEVHWLLCGSVASVLLITALIGFTFENKDHHHGIIEFHKKNNQHLLLVKVISFILTLATGIFGKSLNVLMLLGVLIIILAIPALHGLHLWVKSKLAI